VLAYRNVFWYLLSRKFIRFFSGDREDLETVQTADVFPGVKLTSDRRLAIIDSSVDEVVRLETDRMELQRLLCGIF